MEPSAPTPTILVVAELAAMREIVSIALTNIGFRVVQAENRFQAIDALDDLAMDDLDLVVTDMNTPKDGLALVEAIRADGRRSGIAVIALSSQADELDQRLRRAGADAVMMKPFDRNELVQTIEHLLTRT